MYKLKYEKYKKKYIDLKEQIELEESMSMQEGGKKPTYPNTIKLSK
jgi:hypothetical protein